MSSPDDSVTLSATLPTLPAPPAGQARPAPPPQEDFPPRELDEYRLVEPLGKGGMGHVYRYHDTTLGRDVAIKFLLHPDAAYQERFQIEARAAARLQHPNIVSVYRTGQWRDQPYIVEEYVRGHSMAALGKPVPWLRALELCTAVARGLAAAHRHQVLHRDIKPANVIIADGAQPKILDFGLAKLLDAADADVHHPGADARAQPPGCASLTRDGALVGTPHYIAPEIWRGQPATARADVYSFGVLMFELCTGRVPHHEVPVAELSSRITEEDAPSLARLAPNVDRRFAAVVDRCLARRPEDRFASGEAARDALEALSRARQSTPAPAGCPYRGLLPFDAEHRGLLFGRESDVRAVVERLRARPAVLVAGESGVGKSSLARAGVLPRIADTAQGDAQGNAQGKDRREGRDWEVWSLVPGRHPFSALVAELGHRLGVAEAVLAEELASDVAAVVRRIREACERGVVVFIDQLEELVTLSDPDEALAAAEALAGLVERAPMMRLLATVRGDKVTDLARLPGLGGLVESALYILRPLGEDEIRQTIVGPARAKGVRFESDALVDTLVAATLRAQGGLPLLQFALSRLWEARDVERALIPDRALDEIGGVEGALAQHADGVLDALLPDTREAARRILLRLVTLHGTRGRHSEEELAGDDTGDDRARRAALDALVAGRLVVVHEADGQAVYELAHEALITGWTRLRHWLDKEGDLRAIKERLAGAAREWARMGRARDALWRGRRLREAWEIEPEDLSALEGAFLRASRRAESRARRLRRVAVVAPLLLAGLIYAVLEHRAAQKLRRDVERLRQDAAHHLARAHGLHRDYTAARARAFAGFRSGQTQAGEAAWSRATALAPELDAAYEQASIPLELALLRAPERADVRHGLADILYERARLAESLGHHSATELIVQRLALYDDSGERMARWQTPIRVTLETSPPSLPVRVARYVRQDDGALELVDVQGRARTPAAWSLAPGSYLFVVHSQQQTLEVRYPLRLQRGTTDTVQVHIDVPATGAVPEGFVFIPGGAFLFGYGSDRAIEPVRTWYKTWPLHERRTGPYLISRHETTYAQWIAFLRALDPEQRARRLPGAHDPSSDTRVALLEQDGDFVFVFRNPAREYRAAAGQAVVYEQRDASTRTQRWLRMPVTGISGEDARAYVAWLDRTGQVPGARLCHEDEWERAARGADARLFPHGDRLLPGDANFDKTYGKRAPAFGFDEVGSHERSQSPFGVHDMVGNARELARSMVDDALVSRGGAYFYSERTNAIVNRETTLWKQRMPYVGFRVCADWPSP